MDISLLSENDKHILFGLLLKKMISRQDDQQVMSILQRIESLNKKIIHLLQFYEKHLLEEDNKIFGEQIGKEAAIILEEKPHFYSLLKDSLFGKDFQIIQTNSAVDVYIYLNKFDSTLIIIDEDIAASNIFFLSRVVFLMKKNASIIYLCNISPEDRKYYIANKEELNLHYINKSLDIKKIEKKISKIWH